MALLIPLASPTGDGNARGSTTLHRYRVMIASSPRVKVSILAVFRRSGKTVVRTRKKTKRKRALRYWKHPQMPLQSVRLKPQGIAMPSFPKIKISTAMRREKAGTPTGPKPNSPLPPRLRILSKSSSNAFYPLSTCISVCPHHLNRRHQVCPARQSEERYLAVLFE